MKKQVGALWKRSYKKDGDDVSYLSGVIDLGVMGTVDIAVFKNDKKDQAKHPDYRIILSEKKNSQDNDAAPEEQSETGVW